MLGVLEPIFKETYLGTAEVRNTFRVPKVGVIAGCYVTEGKITRNAEIRLLRDNVVIFEGKIASLKRFKDDASEVPSGYECGIGIQNFNDVKVGDSIEAFFMESVMADAASLSRKRADCHCASDPGYPYPGCAFAEGQTNGRATAERPAAVEFQRLRFRNRTSGFVAARAISVVTVGAEDNAVRQTLEHAWNDAERSRPNA